MTPRRSVTVSEIEAEAALSERARIVRYLLAYAEGLRAETVSGHTTRRWRAQAVIAALESVVAAIEDGGHLGGGE